MVMGFAVLYNLFTTLFGNNDSSTASEPSIPNPIPILDANLTASVCGQEVSCCPYTRYRSLDGSCNNLENPGWGTTKSTYMRLLENRYSDSIFKLPRMDTGDNMPNARELSIRLFKDKITYDIELNVNGMQWGQVITHDMSKLEEATDAAGQTLVCCRNGKLTSEVLTNEFCAPVIVPYNDRVHRPGSCLEFVRADTDRHIGCVSDDQEANQLNMVTPFMDSSMIYGSTDEESNALRSFENGNLETVTRRGREWPPQAQDPEETCEGDALPGEPCYKGGDTRINQNTELSVLQVLLLLWHNFIADGLSEVNPQWDDQTLFQEARSIVVAVLQNINYYEYLPYLLGEKNMLDNKLIYRRTPANIREYINDYDPILVPGVIMESATAALRYFHTLIQGYLLKKFEDRSDAGEIRLSEWYNRPVVIERNNTFDQLVVGLTAQSASATDPFFTVEVTEYLFRGMKKVGRDLRTVDVIRGRDMGLGSYQQARAACNLTVPRTFEDLRGIIGSNFIKILRRQYQDVSNIDLTVGGTLEIHVPGSRAGPTFLCIMLAQFYRTRVADRFWFENGIDEYISFTPDQLASIRGVTMASIFCESTDIGTIQPAAFEVISPDNPVVSCDVIPSIDLTLWRDDGTEEYEAQQDQSAKGVCAGRK
ncbi:peroxidase-like [Aricia agestis]|uniref:peroxidase-like n=1 Tax=Aricia agestis TaxID=91739 RepID=UPI001C2019F8|nr:peroxidase-like [Aricia agestis]